MHRALLFITILSTLTGCSGSTTSDDAATLDTFAVDAAHAGTGSDAASASDAPTDSFVAGDVGPDAFVAGDGGSDAFVTHDAGHDAAPSTGVDCDACNAQDGMECAYPLADGCSAVAQCVAIPPGTGCGAIMLVTACDCEGNDRMWHGGGCHPTFPTGLGPAPIAHMGACP